MKPRRSQLLVGLLLLPWLSSVASPPILSQATPEVDGRIAPGEWDAALPLGKLTPREGGSFPETEVWATFDGDFLYLAIRCSEPRMDRVKHDTLAEELKAPVWHDDSVEVFLDLGNTGKAIHHLVANLNGTYYDSRIIQMREVPSAWESNARARTSRHAAHWEIEIALPWDSLGHRLEKGEVFALNIGRNRHAGGTLQIASLADGHYAFPQHFRRILIKGPLEIGGARLISTRRGPFLENEAGSWEFERLSPDTTPLQVVLNFTKNTPPATETRTLPPNERFLSIPFSKEQAEGHSSLSLATPGGSPLFQSEYALQTKQLPARVATTRDPVFNPQPNPKGLAKSGVLFWPHEILRPLMGELPFRTAFASDAEAPYRQYGKDHAVLFLNGAVLTPERLKLLDRHGVSVAYCLDARRALPAEVSTHPKYRQPWLLDPRAIDAYLTDARKAIALAKEHPSIRYLAAGDETWEVMHRNLLRLLDQRAAHPELQKADAEVKEKYGFGRYGLPESSTDTNPYRWIATYRWEVEQMLAVHRQIREMVRKDAPHLKTMSWDSVNGMRPYGISRWPEAFDILLHQLYPSSNPRRHEFGAQTRFYTDLGEGAENWPVPHVEHYAGNFTPEEVEEFLSQCLRNGATGFGLYLADTIAERAGKGNPVTDRIGAPERWRVIDSLLTQWREEPFRVELPAADTGIFYSTSSIQATGTGEGHALQFRNHNHAEWLYTLLGPRLRASLAFVDEHLAATQPERLAAFKVVYLPYIPFADDAEYDVLEAYVRNGGQLVVCDPGAFAYRSDGTTRTDGVLLPPRMEKASSPQDSPAITERAVGNGRVLFLAENPLKSSTIDDPALIRLFASLQQKADAKSGHAVWRFRLPPSTAAEEPKKDGLLCLTGNSMEWRGSEPRPFRSAKVTGSYQLSIGDADGKEKAETSITFKQGRLTDRIRGARAANDVPGEEFTLRWQNAGTLEIAYRFSHPVSVHRLSLFYAERLPSGMLEISMDGTAWQALAQWDAQLPATRNEVAVFHIPVEASLRGAHYRLRFSDCRNTRLVETEWWGKEQP